MRKIVEMIFDRKQALQSVPNLVVALKRHQSKWLDIGTVLYWFFEKKLKHAC